MPRRPKKEQPRPGIEHGRMVDKVDLPDPTAASLGTDGEAGGNAPLEDRVDEAPTLMFRPRYLRGLPDLDHRTGGRVSVESEMTDHVETSNGASAPRVIIVGGGFAGLEAAKTLARAPVTVTVIDRENHHCFQPLLYQAATAALSASDIAWPVRSILSRQGNTRVVMAEVTGVDLATRRVMTMQMAPLEYDFLILATGATHSYFGHEDWARYAPGLKTIEDAAEIRRRLLLAFEMAEIEADSAKLRRLLSFIVVGGGPTGVELAGAIAETARHALARDFRRIDPRASSIILVEAGPRLLPAFSENLANYTRRSLERMGVTVRTSTTVTSVDFDGITTADKERIAASTIFWAAGVKASSAGTWLNAKTDHAGRVQVEADLSLSGHPNVFAIGDTATVAWADSRAVPGIAPAAKQMGRYVGRLIAARLDGTPQAGRFSYRHYGDLATVGRRSAVVQVGNLRFKGWLAWIFWSVAHIYFLIGSRNRFSVASDWVWEYITFQRGARLIERFDPARDLEGPRSANHERRARVDA